ncbi:MAG: shikimate kinase [Cellulosilyticaceae bacterium]
MMLKQVYFIGFMGCGKTTYAKKVAKALDKSWIDLDDEIEKKVGGTITHLFETKGESYFRAIESKMLEESVHQIQAIIATGGGIIKQPGNREVLKRQQTIYLKWSFDTLYERIRGDKARPLAKSYEQLLELFKSREAYYEEVATFIVEGEGKSKEVITQEIIELLGGKNEDSCY